MKISRPAMRKVRIEMLPLIDIVFLLLVFFIYAMLSMAVHRGLPVVLPTSSTAKIDQKTTLSVTLKKTGTIFINDEQTTLEELAEVLETKARGEHETDVLLFADRDLSYQTLFRVLDKIRTAGLNHISLQAEADQ
jgi:biopolymer transport protein ExbD